MMDLRRELLENTKIDKKIVSVSLGTEKKQPQPEIIVPENVILPDDAPARVKTLRAEGRKWYLTVAYHPATETPFALFCHTNHNEKSAQTSDAIDRMTHLALSKGISPRFVEDLIEKSKNDSNVTKLTKTISLLLRHGVLISNIVTVLDKMTDIYIGSFLFQIKKFLSNYIIDGSISVGNACSECGTGMIFTEGCLKCPSCGNSKCG
jgi:hypothetical protein